MAEAFGKTLKRDYAYVNRLPPAAEVIAQLPDWLTDYKTISIKGSGCGLHGATATRRCSEIYPPCRGEAGHCLRGTL
jgi:hypothetical protein